MTERQTWPEHAWPTPDQWLEWFLSLGPERQLEVAALTVQNAQEAAECFDSRHQENLHDLRNGLMKLQSELEALRDSMVAQSPDDASEGLPESLSEPQSLPDANWIAPASHDGERSSHT